MVEFGEQLRRAREAKGMTQQSLAEQVYVTRQAVSRWECGDRYPDLLTTKKISLILDVSLDDLLSGNEMKKVVERNAVIEKALANNIMIALYAFIVFSYAVTVADIIIRFPLNSKAIDLSDIQAVVIHLTGLIAQIVVFAFGLIYALKGMLSPKRMGIVVSVFFVSVGLASSNRAVGGAARQLVLMLALMIPSMIGAVSAFLYFVKAKSERVCPMLLYLASAWGIILIVVNNYMLIRYAGDYLSMNTALNILLRLCIYTLIIYQTYVLGQKRKKALDVKEKQEG